MSETAKKKRSRSKKVTITGSSVTVNGVTYGVSAMQTDFTSSMTLPSKDEVQEICAECYMKLLRSFTNGSTPKDNEPISDVAPVDPPL